MGTSVRADGASCLLALKGIVEGKQRQFLLDSGASCNFVSKKLLLSLGVDWDLTQS